MQNHPRVQFINAPSYPRIVNLWLRVGMIVGGAAGLIFMAVEGMLEALLAIEIPLVGLAIFLGFAIVAAAFVGVGALAGMIIGNIHYAIARASYENRSRSNI